MNYAGITFGPVIEALSATYTPAGLWFSSYFFSRFVRSCAMELQEKGYEIITLEKGYRIRDNLKDRGVGRYHDRIYFRGDRTAEELRQNIFEAKKKAIAESASMLVDGFAKAGRVFSREDILCFFNEFLQIHFVIFPEAALTEKGVAKTLADTLDTLELSQSISSEPSLNYLFEFAEGDPYKGSNDYLRHYAPLVEASKEKAFRIAAHGENVRIRDIGYIASNGRYTSKEIESPDCRLKKTGKYFAIVQCDGDNMGELISGAAGPNGNRGSLDEQVSRNQAFSAKCMAYAEKAYELVSSNGGFLIYAGGDDLLFLSPVISEKANVWSLCRDIAAAFDQIFNADGTSDASLSLGMSINYYKYPLYEAFQDALGLLFADAKKFVRGMNNKYKNNAAIRIHKASGQSMGTVLCMETMGRPVQAGDGGRTLFQRFLALLDLFKSADRKKTNELMTSLLYHIESQSFLFYEALDNGLELHTLLDNVFDGPDHGEAKKIIEEIEGLITASWEAFRERKLKNLGAGRSVEAVASMLRMAKFLVEE